VVGKSRGYLNPSVSRQVDFRLESGYSVPATVPNVAPTPPSMHTQEGRSYLPKATSAQMVRVPDTADRTSGPPCPPELTGRALVAPVVAVISYGAPEPVSYNANPITVYPAVHAAPAAQVMARPADAVVDGSAGYGVDAKPM
jgi:hypothetical protein